MSNYKFETLQLHVGQEQPDPATDARAVPIYATTSYVFRNCEHAAARFGLTDAGNIYGRLTNSTQDVLEKRIAALEGGVAALAVASGAAAIDYVLQALGQNGGHFVAQKTIYGGSYNLLEHTLPGFGITATFVNIHDLDEVEKAIRPNTRAIYIETLGNPNSDIPDIDALAALAHKYGLPLVVDNTFGTPYLIRPIEHGADIVVHSATKFLGGHGTTLGGIIVDSGKFDWAASGKYPAIAAPNPSYHGVSFVAAAGPAAFVTYIRRCCCGTPARPSLPSPPFCCYRAWRPCPCGLTGMWRTPRRWWNIFPSTPWWRRSTILPFPIIPSTSCIRSTSPTAAAPFSPSRSRAA